MSPAKSSAPRGDETREALLAAAIEVFGRDGFHAASTRAIASAAGANQALIGYHFGGKQGLYLAAFESITAQVQQRMLPQIESLSPRIQALQENSIDSRRECVACIHQLFSAMLDVMGHDDSAPWVRLIMREQLDPHEAISILYEGIFGQMLGLLTHLVALADGLDEASETAKLRALMLLGHNLVFLIARGTTQIQMGWTELGDRELAAIKQQLLFQLQARFHTETE
jgi:AcrR family transcriptional regulator